MNLQEIAEYAENKTKIYIYSPTHEVEDLVLHIIHFLDQPVDFVSAGNQELNDNEFIILSTDNIEDIEIFEPNIVLITDVLPLINVGELFSKIVSGGILVYPDNAIVLETQLTKVENFFRKLPFSRTNFSLKNETFSVNTVLGEVPLTIDNKNLIEKIEGIRLFCQQLGIMEEEFYEAVMNFE